MLFFLSCWSAGKYKVPPSSPASGPRSITQSAERITSVLCSITRMECPVQSGALNDANSFFFISRKCRPVVGSSKMKRIFSPALPFPKKSKITAVLHRRIKYRMTVPVSHSLTPHHSTVVWLFDKFFFEKEPIALSTHSSPVHQNILSLYFTSSTSSLKRLPPHDSQTKVYISKELHFHHTPSPYKSHLPPSTLKCKCFGSPHFT